MTPNPSQGYTRPQNPQDRQKDSVVDEIRAEINKLPGMKALKPEKFAEPGGLAERFASDMKDKLKATQLRRFFHEVKDLKLAFETSGFDRSKIAMLMPMLAYAKGRKVIPDSFYELMTLCFGSQKCRDKYDFDRAVDFLEAILAYHKMFARNA